MKAPGLWGALVGDVVLCTRAHGGRRPKVRYASARCLSRLSFPRSRCYFLRSRRTSRMARRAMRRSSAALPARAGVRVPSLRLRPPLGLAWRIASGSSLAASRISALRSFTVSTRRSTRRKWRVTSGETELGSADPRLQPKARSAFPSLLRISWRLNPSHAWV